MEKRLRKSIRLGQNYLKSKKLVGNLVRMSSICKADTVIEIGPGRGMITNELVQRAAKVIAIERDRALVNRLKDQFRGVKNVSIIEGDFRRLHIRDRGHKIFANIPFNITAEVVRRILFSSPGLSEAYLIIQREPARKFSGDPHETLFSILAKPYFELTILRRLKRTDFEPVPAVDPVLLRIKRRPEALVGPEVRDMYEDLVRKGFQAWKPTLRGAYKGVFTYKQWKTISNELGFQLNATPTMLTFEQWLGLFRVYIRTKALECDLKKR
jgi:23S rRNA (adenine-N6)-dimethyltransferase